MVRFHPTVMAASTLLLLSWGCGEPWREAPTHDQDGGADLLKMAHDMTLAQRDAARLADLPGAPADAPTSADSGASPDLGPPVSVPAPPFGDNVGMTARNFRDLPDCDVTSAASACAAQLHDLHDYYDQYDGVVVALLRPG